MQIESFKQRVDEFVAAVKDVDLRSEEAIKLYERQLVGLEERVSDWARDRVDAAKADGRETMHADDSRKALQLRALMGDARSAFAGAVMMYAQSKANRAKFDGDAGGRSSEKSVNVFPSMREYKAQAISSDPGGGYLVDAGVSGLFFDRLRPDSVVLAAGPMLVDIVSDRIRLPKLSSSVTVVRAGEGGTITDSDMALELVTLTARKYATRTIASSELFADSNPPAREILTRDHLAQLAAALDLDMLEGTGVSGKLMGLRNDPNVTKTSLGANGGAPTLGDVIDAIERLERDNAKASAIFMHPRTWKVFRKLQDTTNRYQLQPDPTEAARRSLFGVPVFLSSQVSITETVGSSTDCSYIIVADMSRVVVGKRQDMNVLYDPFSKSSTDQIVVQTTTRWGFGVLDDEAVEVITGVRT